MSRTVSVGSQSFSDIRESGCFLVDKTMLIKDWWDNHDTVTLITRPRRFGKTLNIDMLNCFFSNGFSGRTDLFDGLEIWKYEKYRELQGTYPVIFLSFAGIMETNYEGIVFSISRRIRELFIKNRNIIESDDFSEVEKNEFTKMMQSLDKYELSDSIRTLSRYLYISCKIKPIILLDEYDTPLQEAYINGYWDEMSSFIRNLFNNTFKTNEYFSGADKEVRICI